ncbi:MAG: cytochrome C, partial [Acidobacteriaceae bacterium]|nr:cytochrome C [Acidobacteriaceae bacterium]
MKTQTHASGEMEKALILPRALALAILVAACANAQSLANNSNVQTPASNTYVGSMVCKTCHPDVWFRFYKNPHFKSIAAGTEKPEDTGCEGCHGPGGAHVKAHGGKATIIFFPRPSPRATLDACLRCHSETLSRANIHRSPHTLNNVVCTECHSIHKSTTPKFLLSKAQPELCYGCHTEVRADFSMPFKHRVNEG